MGKQEQLDTFGSDSIVGETVEEYLDHLKENRNLKETTVKVRQQQLRYLEDYCEEEGIETRSRLLSHDLDEYRAWLRSEAPTGVDELAESTITATMRTVERFVAHLEEEHQ